MPLFTDFDLHQNTIKALEKMGFATATEIQEQFIPAALKGEDVMASAQTGSGKTAAFLIPAFEKIFQNHQTKKSRIGQGPRVLILTPTRELAAQVMDVANKLQAFGRVNIGSVTGGVSMHKQVNMFRKGVDVVVATPGRMVDLINRNIADLSNVETFVLDEADRMLDMGFSKDVLTIANSTPKGRQTLLLSATLDGKVGSVIKKVMNNPFNIELAHAKQRHENIDQCLYLAKDREHKNALLDVLIEDNNIWQGVIFMATKRNTEKMAKRLGEKGETVAFIHGDMRQSARNTAIRKMQKGDIRFLIATDVAARGLDIDALTHVINFDLPQCPEDYTHRIGRVGRAGKKGVAISLVSNDQKSELSDIEHLIGLKIVQKTIPGLEYVPSDKKGKQPSKPKGGARRGQSRKPTFGKSGKQTSQKSRKRFDSTEEKKPFTKKAKPATSKNRKKFGSSNEDKPSFAKKTTRPEGRDSKRFDAPKGEGRPKRSKSNKTNRNKGKPNRKAATPHFHRAAS